MTTQITKTRKTAVLLLSAALAPLSYGGTQESAVTSRLNDEDVGSHSERGPLVETQNGDTHSADKVVSAEAEAKAATRQADLAGTEAASRQDRPLYEAKVNATGHSEGQMHEAADTDVTLESTVQHEHMRDWQSSKAALDPKETSKELKDLKYEDRIDVLAKLDKKLEKSRIPGPESSQDSKKESAEASGQQLKKVAQLRGDLRTDIHEAIHADRDEFEEALKEVKDSFEQYVSSAQKIDGYFHSSATVSTLDG